MCGADKPLFVTVVEGVELNLCENCKVYGEVKRRIPTPKETAKQGRADERQGPTRPMSAHVVDEAMELVVPDFAPRIKHAREKLGMKQEDLAKRLALKESQLHTYESGSRKPDIGTARMLERALNIKLVEQYVEKHEKGAHRSDGPLTIADILKR